MAQFESTRGNLPGPDVFLTDTLKRFQDGICGGAWPLVVRGLTCLALIQLTSEITAAHCFPFSPEDGRPEPDFLRLAGGRW